MERLKPIFEQITPIICEPSYRYRLFRNSLEQQNISYPDTYVSTTITSGGFARIYKPNGSPDWLQLSIQQNGNTAAEMVNLLREHHVINPEQNLIFPPHLGKIPKGQEKDYMLFWFHVISGVDPSHAESIDKKLIPQFSQTFSDHSRPRHARLPHYQHLIQQYGEAVSHVPHNPVKQVLQLIDTHESLGCYAEEQLAHQLGIDVLSVFLRSSAHTTKSEIREQIAALHKVGVNIFHEEPSELYTGLLPVIQRKLHLL